MQATVTIPDGAPPSLAARLVAKITRIYGKLALAQLGRVSSFLRRGTLATERRLASLYERALTSSMSATSKSKIARLVVPFSWWMLTAYVWSLQRLRQLTPGLFRHLPVQRTPPSLKHWRHDATALLLPTKAMKASYFDAISLAFFEFGHADEALVHARRARALKPNAQRHHAVLRYMLSASGEIGMDYLAEAKAWSAEYEKTPSQDDLEAVEFDRSERPIRVGLLCDYLHSVIGRFTIQPQILAHNPNRTTIFVYDFGEGSYLTRKICPNYRHLKGQDDQTVLDVIRQDRIDVLIEMNGWLRPDHKFELLMHRPAPIQVSWYNLPATCGLKAMDHVIADDYAAPPHLDAHFTEKIVRLKGGATGGWTLPNDPPVAKLPAFERGYFTFGCFGDMFKYSPEMLDAWAKILHRTPHSRLYLKCHQMSNALVRSFIFREFAHRDVDPRRLRLEGPSPYQHMRELYGEMDLGLDTFPFSGGSTTMNALWQGIPVVCIAGSEWRGRYCASIQANADLHQFIAANTAEFVERAVALASDLKTLGEVRAGMRERLLDRSTYYRMDRYVPSFEDALEQMRDQHWSSAEEKVIAATHE